MLKKNKIMIVFISVVLSAVLALPVYAEPLIVCTTIPDLGDLTKQIGGKEVEVTVFVKGSEDPHFLEARPSFIKRLSRADLYIEAGLELEISWAPVLLLNSRNSNVQVGGLGYLDASEVIDVMEMPSGVIDRSLGDVHPMGNPHYLMDPVCGLKVAAAILEKLIMLRPEKRKLFENGYENFRHRLSAKMIGEGLAGRYDPEKMAVLYAHGKLKEFLNKTGELQRLGGWMGMMMPLRGVKVVADHNLWPYFADRFGLNVVAYLEPKPGMQPTTRHLRKVIGLIKAKNIDIILSAAYFPGRHSKFVAEKTGATVLQMAHQVGARPEADNYLSMVDYNIRQIVTAFESAQ